MTVGGRARTALAAAVVALVMVVPVAGAFGQPGAPMEEGKLLTAAELVLDGKVPHVDFEHFYGPADVWAVAASMAVLGHRVGAERALGVAYVVLLLAAVFVLVLSMAGRVAAAVAAVACGWLLVPFGVHAYSWTAGLALLLAAVAVAVAPDRTTATTAAVAGALAGLALLFRADLLVALVAVIALLWPALDRRQRVAGLVGGAVTGALPYLVHLATAGPSAMWRGMVTDTLFRLRDGRSLPVPPPAHDLTAWLDLSAPEPAPSPLLPDPARVTQLRAFFWMTVVAIAVAVAVAAWVIATRRLRSREGRALACMGAVLLTIAPQMLQRADATHVRFVACVAIPLAPVVLAGAWRLLDERAPRAAAATEGIALAMVAVVLAVPFYAARLAGTVVGRGLGRGDTARAGIAGRSFPVIDPLPADATALLRLVDERGPARGARLFVGPQDLRLANYSDAFLYFVLGERYRPASFYLESNPGIANRPGSGLAADLRRADVLILSKEYDNWDEPNASRRQGPAEPSSVVERDFCVAGEAGRYRVYLRCQ